MKTIVPVSVFLLFTLFTRAQSAKDLPAPTSNLQTLSAGSYVIPMDNTLQTNTAGYFNLKTYGLIVHLLNNNVKIKWAIKAGKSKDGTDFTGTALQIQPTLGSVSAIYNFIAGPFVISAADTTGVAALVTSFYTNNGLTGNDRPSVYRLTLDALNVDIRYNLTGFIPKAAILNDGGNAAIHTGYFQKAAVSTNNYQIAAATDLLSKCYTFASEPHADTTAISATKINAVKSFVTYGGNFLAQCEAVLSYENRSQGYFQTTTGITKVNTAIASSSTIYPNPDLAYSQFQGEFGLSQGGSVRNWVLAAASSFKNNAHHHATGGTLAAQTPFGASVCKMNGSSNAGGLVFYLGNHEFSSITSLISINGIRMYMNAFLTPTSLNLDCSIGSTRLYVLSLQLEQFNVNKKQDYAELTWVVNRYSTASRFIIERSTDGQIFREAGIVLPRAAISEETYYTFRDPVIAAVSSTIYYRIRSEDSQGKYNYSAVKAIRIGETNTAVSISTFPNPVVNQFFVQFPLTWANKQISYEVIDQNGRVAIGYTGIVANQTQEINLNRLLPGFYYLRVSCNGEVLHKKILKK